jgi:hypothetical protein
MNNATSNTLVPSVEAWRRLFEAALLERDSFALPRRLQDAKHAIMDRIEGSFDTAALSERRLLLAALNTISELQRLANIEDMSRSSATQAFSHAA